MNMTGFVILEISYNYKNGLESVWRNVHSLHRNYIKCKTQQGLEDQYIQKYDAYISEDNLDIFEKSHGNQDL